MTVIRFPGDYRERHGPISEEARQAIIEHRRTMKDVRQWQAENRERIDAEWDALSSPPRTIEGHIASLRDTDPEKWAELNRMWIDDAREVRRG